MNIKKEDIKVGTPLPWNVFNRNGQLLLKKGYSIISVGQVKRLYEQGYLNFNNRRLPLAFFMISLRRDKSMRKAG